MPSEFIFQATKVHLTYRGHIEQDVILARFASKGMDAPQYWSVVWEKGDVPDEPKEGEAPLPLAEDQTPYEHTHAAFMWFKKQRVCGADWADVVNPCDADPLPVHPHSQVKRSIVWMQHIMTKYHLGHKTKANGKKYFIAPVRLFEQHLPVNWSADIYSAIVAAPTLQDAMEVIDCVPKTISDIKSLRNETLKRGNAEMEDDCTLEYVDVPSDWDRKKKTLVIVGPPGIGKTNFVKKMFRRPDGTPGCHEVTQLEDLQQTPEGTVGLLFDDPQYGKFNMIQQKMITDCRKACSIYARHKNSRKPHLPAVFTCNYEQWLPEETLQHSDPAIQARIYVWEVQTLFCPSHDEGGGNSV